MMRNLWQRFLRWIRGGRDEVWVQQGNPSIIVTVYTERGARVQGVTDAQENTYTRVSP